MSDGGPPLQVILSSLSATKYTTVASATLLLWDMALTLDDEIARVWRAKKTRGTTLFFLNRYIPPALFILDLYSQFVQDPAIKASLSSLDRVANPKSISCRNYEYSSTIMDLVSIGIIEAVLIMRTNALYQNKALLIFLVVLGVASVANMLTFFLIVIKYETFIPASALGMRGCLSGCTSSLCQPLLIAFWVPFIALETIIFFLTAFKSYKSLRVMRYTGKRSIVHVIMRDGLLYYIVIMGAASFRFSRIDGVLNTVRCSLAVSSCNFIIWIVDPFASYLAVGLLKSLQATICSRLLLNLRGVLESKGPRTTSEFELQTPTSPTREVELSRTFASDQMQAELLWHKPKS